MTTRAPLVLIVEDDDANRKLLTRLVTGAGMGAREHRIAGINAGADDFLTKPFDIEELHARVASPIRLKRYTDELDSAESVILSLALTVEARDAYTEGHCQRLKLSRSSTRSTRSRRAAVSRGAAVRTRIRRAPEGCRDGLTGK